MQKAKISKLVIPRLSLYYRALINNSGSDCISSQELAKLTDFSAAQIRKDLAYFGQFGRPGKGYFVDDLKRSIIKILGTDKRWPIVLIGVGNLGSALLSYQGFHKQEFDIVYAFDKDRRKIGKTVGGVGVQDIKDLKKAIKKSGIKMAILCVPGEAAQSITDILVKSGTRAILSFAPTRVSVPKGVELLNIDLSIELERLAYFLAWRYAYLHNPTT